jgi:hypothetical protein
MLFGNSHIVIYLLFMIKLDHLLKLNIWHEPLCTYELIAPYLIDVTSSALKNESYIKNFKYGIRSCICLKGKSLYVNLGSYMSRNLKGTLSMCRSWIQSWHDTCKRFPFVNLRTLQCLNEYCKYNNLSEKNSKNTYAIRSREKGEPAFERYHGLFYSSWGLSLFEDKGLKI